MAVSVISHLQFSISNVLASQRSPNLCRCFSPLQYSSSRRCLIFPRHGQVWKAQNPVRHVMRSSLESRSKVFGVLQSAWEIGKDAIEAGGNLIPDIVPKPVRKFSAALVLVYLSFFMLKSILSTAIFIMVVVGLMYFVFTVFFEVEEDPSAGDRATLEDSSNEAGKVMDKYKEK